MQIIDPDLWDGEEAPEYVILARKALAELPENWPNALQDALSFARHEDGCTAWGPPHKCDCGYAAAIAKLDPD
jgi:hypothetical protein